MPKSAPLKVSSCDDDASDDECYLQAALRQLQSKLSEAQPTFTEEDVAVVPFPSPGGSPRASPGADSDGPDDSPFPSPGGPAAAAAAAAAVDLAGPVTARQLHAAVGAFDARAVLRNRRAAADVLRLAAHGYALVWRDAAHLSPGGALRGRTAARAKSVTVGSPPLSPPGRDRERDREGEGEGEGERDRAEGGRWSAPVSPTPRFTPAARLVALLDRCIQSLLIFANGSVSLRTMITSSAPLLRRFVFICQEARRLEAAPHRVGTWRDVDVELSELYTQWRTVTQSVAALEALQECYLTEFLLDAALPPAVCSARYDGLATALCEKKERLVMEIISPRSGHSGGSGGGVAQPLSLRAAAALVGMSAFAEPRLRARLLDRLAGDGLVLTLRDAASAALRESADAVAGRSPAPREKLKRRSASPPLRQLRDAPERVLGYCLDVLRPLTAPNLAEAPVGVAAAVGGARVPLRASAWAARVEELREICACLLRAACRAHASRSLASARPIVEEAMECVRQVAGYSAVLYGAVVEELDEALDECRRRDRDRDNRDRDNRDNRDRDGGGGGAAALLPLVLELLVRHPQHAEAHAASVQRWFAWLADCLAPQAFDVPVLAGPLPQRRSRQQRQQRRRRRGGDAGPPAGHEAPVLGRALRRDEAAALSPFFRFAARLVAETTWRRGAEAFLARIAVLAHNVALMYARRPNMLFGQASACYDAVAPLLEPVVSRSFSPPVSPGKTPLRAMSSSSAEEVTMFIPSPSQSPLFFESYTPSTSTRPSTGDGDGGGGGDDVDTERSPVSGVVASWRRRLSFSVLQALLGESPRE